MMVVEWIQRRCVVAWVLDFQIRSHSLLLDGVRILTYFSAIVFIFPFIFIFQLGLLDGNGFKTSTMRLGADAIVFSCHLNNRYASTSECNSTLKMVKAMCCLLYLLSPYYVEERTSIIIDYLYFEVNTHSDLFVHVIFLTNYCL